MSQVRVLVGPRCAERQSLNADLENLKQAHHGDLAITKATKQVKSLRDALRLSTLAHKEALAKAEALERKAKEVWREQKRTEESTRSYEAQRANAVRALEQGAGSADAAERQIQQCEDILDELETATLELMEQQENLARQLADANTNTEAKKRAAGDMEASTPTEIQELKEIIREHTASRDSALSALERSLRDRYDALVTRKGTAMAPIRRDACSACRRVVPPQQVVDLRLLKLQTCRGCCRWLLLEDTPN